MAVVLPVNKIITDTYLDITADVTSMDLSESEVFTIYNDSGPRIEIIADTTGVAVIDDTYNKKGVDIHPETTGRFTFRTFIKYYARTKAGNSVLIKLDKIGATNIHDVDFHAVPFNELFHEHAGVDTTIAVDSLAQATSITVASAVGFAIGDDIQIENGVIETTFPKINNIVGNVFTLDRPLDNAFLIGDGVEKVEYNMAVVGSLAAPISFKLIPDKDQRWHIMGFSLSMVHPLAGDDTRFGDILGGLLNGACLRAFNGVVGQYRTLTNWKLNSEISLDTGGIIYNDKAGGGNFGTFALGEIKERSGAVPKINGANGDYLEILIQDDLSTLVSFNVKSQGHLETI